MTNGTGQDLRILFVTQELNSSSVNLAVAHNWTRELAKRVDSVHVLAGRVVDTELPPNVYVHSLGRESRRSRGRRVYQFGATCMSLLASGRVNAVLAHMVPAYAVAIGPVARLARAPLVLWYTSHGKSSALIWADRIVNAAVTASMESYPIPSNRAFSLGHGIDTQRFAPSGLPLSGTGSRRPTHVSVPVLRYREVHQFLHERLVALMEIFTGVQTPYNIVGEDKP